MYDRAGYVCCKTITSEFLPISNHQIVWSYLPPLQSRLAAIWPGLLSEFHLFIVSFTVDEVMHENWDQCQHN